MSLLAQMLGVEVSRELTSAASATTPVCLLTGLTGKPASKPSMSYSSSSSSLLIGFLWFLTGTSLSLASKPRWHEHKGIWPGNDYQTRAGCLAPRGLVTGGKVMPGSLLEDVTSALQTSPTVSITETCKLQQQSWRCSDTLGAVFSMETAKCLNWRRPEE